MKFPQLVVRPLLAAFALSTAVFAPANAQSADGKTRDKLMVVVRETVGSNKPDEVLRPTGKMKARLADGREIEMEMAMWEFIGDTHIRFVFDGAHLMMGARPEDLELLGLSNLNDALAAAMANIKRTYGEPKASAWSDGIMLVSGKSPDLDSSYFLDRAFWRAQLGQHPEGLAVAVPERGGLLFAPMSDTQAVEAMKRGVPKLYETAGPLRVSSAVFLFKGDKWTVLQAPAAQ